MHYTQVSIANNSTQYTTIQRIVKETTILNNLRTNTVHIKKCY